MNTWGYIFVIAMLALLAGFMLYVRLRMRSREKSLHHTLVEPMISTVVEEKEEIIHQEEAVAVSPVQEVSEIEESHREVEVVAVPVAEKDPARQVESDYIDELQEAAAGLAALMRSSPVARTQPVVFAPEDEVAEEESESAPPQDESVEAESEVPACGDEEVTLEEEALKADRETDEPEEFEAPSLRELFGEEVICRFDEIDSGLDALEDLVVSLESNLASLSPLEESEWSESDSSLEAA